jgi:hypothetical protein
MTVAKMNVRVAREARAIQLLRAMLRPRLTPRMIRPQQGEKNAGIDVQAGSPRARTGVQAGGDTN